MDMRCTVVVALLGAFCCYVDGKETHHDNLELGFDPVAVNNAGEPSLAGLLREKRRIDLGNNWWLGSGGSGAGSLGYDFGQGYWTSLDAYNYNQYGASVGYRRGNWDIMGYGNVNTRGGWGVGGSIGYSWRRKRSVVEPKPSFYLRVEVNPCHFAIYDRNSDGVITDEELSEVFPDRHLADGLFQRLDIEGKGKITEEEFEVAKASGAIVGCVGVPVPKEKIEDSDPIDQATGGV